MTRLTRELAFEIPADLAEDAPIPVVIATDTPVRRFGVLEVLDCSVQGVDLSRAPLPLIVCHDASQLAVGLVEDLQAHGSRVTGLARFGSSPEARQVRADVIAKVHRSVSAGYEYLDEGTPIEGGAMYRWMPHEVSIVPVPADPNAGFFRSLPKDASMPETAPIDRAAVTRDITALCTAHGVRHLTSGLIERGASLDHARHAVLEELARRSMESGGHRNGSYLGADNANAGAREQLQNTLVARLGGRVTGNVFATSDVVSLATRALSLDGQRISDADGRAAIVQRAMGTSDFPLLLGNAVGRVLAQAFEEAPAAVKTIARLNNAPDFRARSVVGLGASSLEKVNEHGEFTYGYIDERAGGWKLLTFGRIIRITRHALINDDLGGFATLVERFGRSAARREADELVQALLTPPQVDGEALFSANRSTLISGADSALSLVGLEKAVQALRAQRDHDGGLVHQTPGALVVPSALEFVARQLVAEINPTQTSNVQPFELSVAVEPRLDATSTKEWYLVARNQAALEYGYLDGEQGVQTEQRAGFEVDGLEIKARLDFGCGWVSPVGWVKSTGAA